MRRVLVIALALGMFASVGGRALATSGAHFSSTSGALGDSGTLVVSWDEAGVGQATVDYTISADGTAVYECINGGGNHPKASNKETVNGPVTTSGSFSKTKNGHINGSLSAAPPDAGSFSCPGGQTLVLASVSYTNIVLTDTTNSVSIFIERIA